MAHLRDPRLIAFRTFFSSRALRTGCGLPGLFHRPSGADPSHAKASPPPLWTLFLIGRPGRVPVSRPISTMKRSADDRVRWLSGSHESHSSIRAERASLHILSFSRLEVRTASRAVTPCGAKLRWRTHVRAPHNGTPSFYGSGTERGAGARGRERAVRSSRGRRRVSDLVAPAQVRRWLAPEALTGWEVWHRATDR